ncbi:TPA: hypothetical protein KQ993_002149 [Clostridioides difficile]|uniref:hypothetical protein n=1 Tax=Clostridioides difficile TaxID=1496 RepID=UPI0013002157|nr:hypothetical protein [Clostridioides difficile]HBG7136643.1 hypothetical protein [Clostridioides difficile]
MTINHFLEHTLSRACCVSNACTLDNVCSKNMLIDSRKVMILYVANDKMFIQ